MSNEDKKSGKRKKRSFGDNGFEEWGGYMAAKKSKLIKQVNAETECSGGIFEGVAIFVNGYTEPSAEELKRIMLSNGGIFHHYYSRRRTSHIIASNLPHTKIRNMDTSRIVKPDWVVESLKANKLLDFSNYLLYTDQSSVQPKLSFKKTGSESVGNDKLSFKKTGSESVENVEGDSSDSALNNLCKDTSVASDVANSNEIAKIAYGVAPVSTLSDTCSRVSSPLLFTSSGESNGKSQGSNDGESKNIDSKRGIGLGLHSESQFDIEKKQAPSNNRVLQNAEDSLENNLSKDYADVTMLKSLRMDTSGPSNTSNPNFLNEFYNNSRLHHISTMGALFKDYVTKLQKKTNDDSGVQRFKKWLLDNKSKTEILPEKISERVVMHIDMDCFFVSVGLRKRPDLVGKPVAVTHARGNPSHKREGVDIEREFNLYRKREQDKMIKKNKSAEKNSGSSHIEDSRDVSNKCTDEGFGDWDDFDDDDEEMCTIAQKLDAVLPINSPTNKSSSGVTEESLSKTQIQSKLASSMQKEEYKGKLSSKTAKVYLDNSSSLSEISSCSYEARKAGVKNGMFLGAALALCPELQTIPYDFEGYKTVSFQLYDIIASYSREIEAVSCDEMYVDVTDLLRHCPSVSPVALAQCIRDHITSDTKCGCSAGLGHSKLAARLATKLAKPLGHVYLSNEAMADHVKTLPVRDLPGVGGSMGCRLSGEGVETCGDLQKLSEARLAGLFGPKTARTLYNYCRGRDTRALNTHHVRKSVSAEVNYGIRFSTSDDRDSFMRQICQEVAQRLSDLHVKGKCISLKLKVRAKDAPVETAKFMGHGFCDNIAKSITLHEHTDSWETIFRGVQSLVQQVKVPPCDYRGVGVQMSRLNNSPNGVGAKQSIAKFLVKEQQPKREALVETKLQGVQRNVSDRPPPSIEADSRDKISSAIKSFKKTKPPKDEKKTLDLDVLRALPSDIREQVIEEYRQQGYIIPEDIPTNNPENTDKNDIIPQDNPSTALENGESGKTCSQNTDKNGTSKGNARSVFPSSPQPGPSGLQPKVVPNPFREENDSKKLQSSGESSEGFDVARPNSQNLDPIIEETENDFVTSFSQVDNSFISAMPEEIKEELRRDFHRQKNVLNILTSPNKPFVEAANSPLKLPLFGLKFDSPSRKSGRGKVSPYKGRGRPRGRKRGRPSNRRILTTRIPSEDFYSESSNDAPTTKEESREEEKPQETPEPSLCGEVSLPNVKSLMKEWLRSCDSPEHQDTEIISDYMCHLVKQKQIEKLDLLLKFFYRQVGQASGAWRSVYHSVLKRVQPVMKEIYGAPLSVQKFDG